MKSKNCRSRSQAQTARKERGASLVEYSILTALICGLAFLVVKAVGVRINTSFYIAAHEIIASGDFRP